MWIKIARALLVFLATVDLLRAGLLLTQQPLVYAVLGRAIIDPVISRQYGIFLLSVVLFYGLLASNPKGYSRLMWVGVAQHGAAALLALSDWLVGDLSTQPFLLVLACELLITVALGVLSRRLAAEAPVTPPLVGRARWMRRVMLGFGGLFVFWAVASTLVLPVGSWLLNYPVIDIYTTKQQGLTFLVIGLSSLLAAADIRRYRLFILIIISSQAFGCLNAAYEVMVGTIPLSGALVQWSIQAGIIGAILFLFPWQPESVLPAIQPRPLLKQK